MGQDHSLATPALAVCLFYLVRLDSELSWKGLRILTFFQPFNFFAASGTFVSIAPSKPAAGD
jgi:hypothetical protein